MNKADFYRKTIMNQRGILTIDFLFAFTLIFSFTILFISFSLTLTVAEVVQYATFAGARSQSAAHIDVNQQRKLGRLKYNEIIQSAPIAPILNNGWFEVQMDPFAGPAGPDTGFPGYVTPQAPGYERLFNGVGTNFISRMLALNIPFFGPTYRAGSKEEEAKGFSTYVASYLLREVTYKECRVFVEQRWQRIRQLNTAPFPSSYATNTSELGYLPISDNGC